MRLGNLGRAGTYYTGAGADGIEWLKPGEWIRTLGSNEGL